MTTNGNKERNSFLLRFFILFVVPGAFLSLLLIYIVSEVTFHKSMQILAGQGENKLQLYETYLTGLLEKYESLPELLANDDMLVSALLNPGSRDRIDKLNRYLETINAISDTSDTYLMDKDGLTIAASNWQGERPFVGRNFSYRPYFKEAMQGVLGRYYALGTTSSRRGYYFAYPVRKKQEILGAVVVKVDINPAEEKWRYLDQEIVVTDPDGVVFISTNEDYRFKVFGELNQDAAQRITRSRRYPNGELTPIGFVSTGNYGEGQLIELKKENSDRLRYFVQQARMEHAGWDIKILSDIKQVEKRSLRAGLIALFSELLIIVFVVLIIQRQRRMYQMKQIEEDTRIMLEYANEQLESRVASRTKELTEANERLTQEIHDRKKTEEVLKQTRGELIHAAKLAALGQLSAGINHEMNQPLAAIRSYADNGMKFMDKNRLEQARWNLEQIAELTERMGQVVAQLKLFSRKSSGQTQIVPLHGAIDGALEILKPSIRKIPIDIHVQLDPENVEVKANNVLLQQVFVNLLNNAIHAVEDEQDPYVKIKSHLHDGRVHILIYDNGKGIKEEELPHIFEPFYSTKISGQGLGLGLTITERILKEADGKIYVTSSEAGTVFEIILEQA